jgi:plasmid replication initiation protein
MQKVVRKKAQKKLYALPSEYNKTIYQPNHVTKAIHNYTLIQERIFVCVIYYLQAHMTKVMNGQQAHQLDIFAERNTQYIDMDIPLRLIGKPYQYNEIRDRAKEMLQIVIEMVVKDDAGKGDKKRAQGLFTYVEYPDKSGEGTRRRSGNLGVRMSNDVAKLLLSVRYKSGTAVEYTKFMFNVALQAQNKYTSRIYQLICSWTQTDAKGQRILTVNYDQLREILYIGDKYRDYEAFKRSILAPVREELKQNADIYFEVSETRDARRHVDKINFIILRTAEMVDDGMEAKLWNSLRSRLIQWFECDEAGVNTIITQLKVATIPAGVVRDKIAYIMTEYLERRETAKPIYNKSAFVIGALKKEFL